MKAVSTIQVIKSTKERMNCNEQWLYQKVTSQLVETVAYVFADISFLDSHSFYFSIKNGFKLLKEKDIEMTPKY